ncbi:hypothetical protein OHV05_13505 [Kitasatospora sp. NBC_00070]|uniref:hypothetical protein n=1 Tax=Kitasatospora sp. NBC_00070 TaxID=2975962 RepID=UPI00324CF9DF
MSQKAQYRPILVVDAQGFGARTDSTQLWLRQQVYRIVGSAAEEAGIELGQDSQDRGDGAFWLLAADAPKVDLSGRFIAHLRFGLATYARLSSAEAALRLRVSLHAGDVTGDEHGWAGTELNTACRLVDLPALKDTLKAAEKAHLVLAVTEEWHRAVIRQGHQEVEPDSFRPVAFQAKEVDTRAWIRVPGYASPPDLPELAVLPDPDPGSAPAAGEPGRPPAGYGTVHGVQINGGTVHGGNYNDHRGGAQQW